MSGLSAQRRGAGAYAYFYILFLLVLFLTHAFLLHLPYFWDEMGQFIPAALDILHDNAWIPRTTLPNVHPPGVMVYLAAIWSVAGYSVVITRCAMLAFSAAGVLAVFALSGSSLQRIARTAGIHCGVSTVGIAAFLLPVDDGPARHAGHGVYRDHAFALSETAIRTRGFHRRRSSSNERDKPGSARSVRLRCCCWSVAGETRFGFWRRRLRLVSGWRISIKLPGMCLATPSSRTIT